MLQRNYSSQWIQVFTRISTSPVLVRDLDKIYLPKFTCSTRKFISCYNKQTSFNNLLRGSHNVSYNEKHRPQTMTQRPKPHLCTQRKPITPAPRRAIRYPNSSHSIKSNHHQRPEGHNSCRRLCLKHSDSPGGSRRLWCTIAKPRTRLPIHPPAARPA